MLHWELTAFCKHFLKWKSLSCPCRSLHYTFSCWFSDTCCCPKCYLWMVQGNQEFDGKSLDLEWKCNEKCNKRELKVIQSTVNIKNLLPKPKSPKHECCLNGIETILHKFYTNFCTVFLHSIQTSWGVIRNEMEFAIWPGAISKSQGATIFLLKLNLSEMYCLIC